MFFWSLSALLADNEISTRTLEPRLASSTPQNDDISTSTEDASILAWQSRTKIHQSSIKTMCSLPISPSTFIIVTGGDDGALGFTRVTYSFNNSSLSDNSQQLLSCSVLLIPNAHAAAVTAVAYLGPSPQARYPSTTENENADSQIQQRNFATTGPDQKLQLWRVSFDLAQPGVEGLRVEKGQWVNTAVADAACLEVIGWEMEGRDPLRILVAGIGLEVRKLSWASSSASANELN